MSLSDPQLPFGSATPVLKVVCVGVGVLLVACVLAPLIYLATEPVRPMLDYPFHRYFSRTLQIAAIAGAVGLALWLRISSPLSLGLVPNPQRIRDLGVGLAAGLLPVAALGAAYVLWDIYRPRKEIEWWGAGRILLSAGAVACIEEFFFRGVLLGLAARAMGAWRAAVAVSALFAVVHFVRPSRTVSEQVGWLSGFHQAWGALVGWPEWPLWFFGLCTLFLAGLILAWVTLRTRSLWAAIGLHAAWILAQQGLSLVAKFRVRPPEALLPWVGPNLVSGAVPTGLIPLLAIALSGLLLWLCLRHVPKRRTDLA
jgi:membrane protease YdiL (CAAX protease family)